MASIMRETRSSGVLIPLAPEETIAFLLHSIGEIVKDIQIAAYVTSRVAVVEAKIILARHIEHDGKVVEDMVRRMSELGSAVALQSLRQVGHDFARSFKLSEGEEPNPHGLPQELYLTRKRGLLDEMRSICHRIHPIWDEPTLRILRAACANLEEELSEFQDVTNLAIDIPISIRGVFDNVPLRDGRFEVIENFVLKQNASTHDERVAELMHHTLMATEIPTIEMCAGIIDEFVETEWELVLDLGRQLWDEARHAQSCIERLRQLGHNVGDFASDHKTWLLTHDQPLVMRLAIHQRLGEWLGVDAAIEWARRLEAADDSTTVHLLMFIMEDEIGHVKIGNKWLRRLCGSEDEVWKVHEAANAVRQAASRNVDGHIPLPLNTEICKRSGFDDSEIARLAEKRPLSRPQLSH